MEKEKQVVLKQIMHFFGKKRVYLSEATAKKELKRRARRNERRYIMPRKHKNFFARGVFDNNPFGRFDYFAKAGSDTAVFYVHGGAFSNQPVDFHWQFIKDIYARTGATVFVPLFPLAPKFTWKQTYVALVNFYKFVSRSYKKIYIIGDSAGATLALGLAHLVMKENLVAPSAVVAMSPVVDMAFSNPEMEKFRECDTMLGIEGAKYMCQKWARGASFKDPLVSPKYIDFKNFPPLYLFYGEYEILCPDLREFTKSVQTQGGKIFAVEQKRALHVYPLMPIPKGIDAREVIANVVSRKKHYCDCSFCDVRVMPQKLSAELPKSRNVAAL